MSTIESRCIAVIPIALMGAMALLQIHTATAQGNRARPSIKIASCTVQSNKNAARSHDCSAEAAKSCDGLAECELQIGRKLSDGKDIDPDAVYEEKVVTVTYACGAAPLKQRGPYPQSDHASLVLDCSM